jgi:N-acetyl-anhydromuramyl-L-alanine amidase AmpD
MKIIEKTYSFGAMDKRKSTSRIILHHAAAVSCSADDVHRWHKGKGWAGIGYHFFIRKDGSIYRGRPQNTVGAHAGGSNYDSVGICFEGNYDTEKSMPTAQKQAGKELVAYLKDYYGIKKVQGHRDVGATACPGKHFPFNEIANATSGNTTVVNESEYKLVQISVPQIAKGSKGPAVEAWQALLDAAGWDIGEHGKDGDFGGDTEKATKLWQKENGLDDDGIVGAKSWSKRING